MLDSQISEKLKRTIEVYRDLNSYSTLSSLGISSFDLNPVIALAVLMEGGKIDVDPDLLAKKIAGYLEPKLSEIASKSQPPSSLKIDYDELGRNLSRWIKMSSGSSLTPYIKLKAEWEYPYPSDFFEEKTQETAEPITYVKEPKRKPFFERIWNRNSEETPKEEEKPEEKTEVKKGKEAIDVVNAILKKISEDWEPSKIYTAAGEKMEYKGGLTNTDDDVSIFFRSKTNQNLFLEVETCFNDGELIYHFTSFHPEFEQGINDLERHFEPKDNDEFTKLLNSIEQYASKDDDAEFGGDIEVEEYADTCKTWSP